MRTSMRMTAVLAVVAIACLSTVHFEVTDSWYSDIDSVEIRVDVDTSILDVTFTISSDDGPVDLSKPLGTGEYIITIEGADVMKFHIESGNVTVGNIPYGPESQFTMAHGGLFVVTQSAILEPIG